MGQRVRGAFPQDRSKEVLKRERGVVTGPRKGFAAARQRAWRIRRPHEYRAALCTHAAASPWGGLSVLGRAPPYVKRRDYLVDAKRARLVNPSACSCVLCHAISAPPKPRILATCWILAQKCPSSSRATHAPPPPRAAAALTRPLTSLRALATGLPSGRDAYFCDRRRAYTQRRAGGSRPRSGRAAAGAPRIRRAATGAPRIRRAAADLPRSHRTTAESPRSGREASDPSRSDGYTRRF